MQLETVVDDVKSEIRMTYIPFLHLLGHRNFHVKQKILINMDTKDALTTILYTTPKIVP
jgi:hypothetical protein